MFKRFTEHGTVSSFKAGFTLSSGFSKRINQRSRLRLGIKNNVACIHDSVNGGY
jgi:hypothetical protein